MKRYIVNVNRLSFSLICQMLAGWCFVYCFVEWNPSYLEWRYCLIKQSAIGQFEIRQKKFVPEKVKMSFPIKCLKTIRYVLWINMYAYHTLWGIVSLRSILIWLFYFSYYRLLLAEQSCRRNTFHLTNKQSTAEVHTTDSLLKETAMYSGKETHFMKLQDLLHVLWDVFSLLAALFAWRNWTVQFQTYR